MPVYVDKARHPYGRMLMSHMVADTTDELTAMAQAIGIDPKHRQHPDTYREHFDVCQQSRAKAIALGAHVIEQWQLGFILASKQARSNPNRVRYHRADGKSYLDLFTVMAVIGRRTPTVEANSQHDRTSEPLSAAPQNPVASQAQHTHRLP